MDSTRVSNSVFYRGCAFTGPWSWSLFVFLSTCWQFNGRRVSAEEQDAAPREEAGTIVINHLYFTFMYSIYRSDLYLLICSADVLVHANALPMPTVLNHQADYNLQGLQEEDLRHMTSPMRQESKQIQA